MDPRIVEHARLLVNYCTDVRRGDSVLAEITDADGPELATEVCRAVARQGAHTLIIANPSDATRAVFESTPMEDLGVTPKNLLEATKLSDVVIHIRSYSNTRFLESLDSKRMATRNKAMQPIQEEFLSKRWNVTIHPTNALAQEAGMSLTEYRDFVYSAVLRDWTSEIARVKPLKEKMAKTDQVRLIGTGTDLSFSIKGRTAWIDDAKNNLPGGEVSTAPVDNSATGKILFDLPSVYRNAGKEVTDIRLTFDKGLIVDYSASKNESLLKELIATDEGSKRLGEFGIGTNMGINRVTKNTLFDEKIAGTIHLAIGRAYEECGGINKSAVHWDMIKTMKPGEVLMDGESIQKDGKFSLE